MAVAACGFTTVANPPNVLPYVLQRERHGPVRRSRDLVGNLRGARIDVDRCERERAVGRLQRDIADHRRPSRDDELDERCGIAVAGRRRQDAPEALMVRPQAVCT